MWRPPLFLRLLFTSDGVGVVSGVVRNSPYDLVKPKNRSRKWIHKRDGIIVERITSLDFLPTPLTTPSLTFFLWSSETSENQTVGVGSRSGRITIAMHLHTICDWFSSFASACDTGDPVFTYMVINDGVVSRTRTLFSLDRKVLPFWLRLRLRLRLRR